MSGLTTPVLPTTAVPPVILGPTGPVLPTEAEVLAGVLADLNTAFGGAMNSALETPQGQLASSETAIIADKNDQVLFLSQQSDPLYADGRYQDALARIYFLNRKPPTPTVVQALCTGLGNVAIPVGTLAQDTAGNVYTCQQSGVIDATAGNVTLPFANLIYGPNPCPAGSLSVYRVVPGLDTISNAADGVLGTVVESRTDFETRREASVAGNAVGLLVSVAAQVFALADVTDCYATENWTSTATTVGGVSLLPNSLYVCVAGDTDANVAQAIWQKKSLGCNYTGNTTVNVQDTSSWYSAPYPTYPVTFERPADATIAFVVTLRNNPAIPANALTLIQTAIINAFAGADGGGRATIGQSLLASRYVYAVVSLGAWAQVLTLTIGLQGGAQGDAVTLNINQIPVTSAADISMVTQ
jgi:hypothetical protein